MAALGSLWNFLGALRNSLPAPGGQGSSTGCLGGSCPPPLGAPALLEALSLWEERGLSHWPFCIFSRACYIHYLATCQLYYILSRCFHCISLRCIEPHDVTQLHDIITLHHYITTHSYCIIIRIITHHIIYIYTLAFTVLPCTTLH